jgi:hypothetical protein
MALVRYQCAICGESIDEGSKLDPCGVSIFSDFNKETSEQLEQMFFCHYECFRDSLDSSVREYLNFENQVDGATR